MTFDNNRYFSRQKFQIQKSTLRVNKKNIFDSIEYEIPFDLINNKIITQTIINNNLIISGIFVFFLGLLFLFGSSPEFTYILASMGLFLTILAFLNRKKVITISTLDGNSIELYFNNQNKVEVMEYANEIIKAANVFLLRKYSKVDRSLPIDPQLERFQYLLNREVITEENFESLKNQLIGTENKYSIGFGQK